MKRQIGICDSDTNYLKMFQAYWQKKNPTDFEILIFDTLDKAVETSHENTFEIFMISENNYDTDVINVKALKLFVLREDGMKEIDKGTVIAKYQSMEKLIGQVLEELVSDDACEVPVRCTKNRTRLISFYSPDRHKSQSIAAMAAAQTISNMGFKVLYINLLPFSGFEELLNTDYDTDITDLMYFALNHSKKLLYKLEGIKRSVQGVDYIPPALDFSDLVRISIKDWEFVFDTILQESDYTYIVTDVSEICQGFYRILEKSDSIYIVSDKAFELGNAMNSHFKRLLRSKEYTDIFEKMTELKAFDEGNGKYQGIKEAVLSPYGAYVRGVIECHEHVRSKQI